MLEEKISQKRKELDESLRKEKDYTTTYKLSVELDELIAEFYKKTKENKKNAKERKKKVLYMV